MTQTNQAYSTTPRPQQPGSVQPWTYPERLPSQAETIMMLTYFIFAFGFLISPISAYLAHRELQRIDAGLADPSARQRVKACWTISVVITVLGALFIGAHLLLFGVLIVLDLLS